MKHYSYVAGMIFTAKADGKEVKFSHTAETNDLALAELLANGMQDTTIENHRDGMEVTEISEVYVVHKDVPKRVNIAIKELPATEGTGPVASDQK